MTPDGKSHIHKTLLGLKTASGGLVTYSEVMNESHTKKNPPRNTCTQHNGELCSSTQQFADCVPVPRAQVE